MHIQPTTPQPTVFFSAISSVFYLVDMKKYVPLWCPTINAGGVPAEHIFMLRLFLCRSIFRILMVSYPLDMA